MSAATPASSSGLSSWLKKGNNKLIAGGGAAVLVFALYMRNKTTTASTTPAANTTSSPTTTSTWSSDAEVESQLNNLSGQVSDLNLAEEKTTATPATTSPTNEMPLAPSSNLSVKEDQKSFLDNEKIAAAIPAHAGDGIYYLGTDGAVLNEGGAPFYGSPREQKKKGKFITMLLTDDGGYSVIDDEGQEYHYAPSKAKAPVKS